MSDTARGLTQAKVDLEALDDYLCKGLLFARSPPRTGCCLPNGLPPNAAAQAPRPPDCNAALVLADGTVFWGHGIGAPGQAVGEVCFNTSITGYQEILTDPSYAGQIINFTFPHIGNVGTNTEDIETATPAARGLVVHSKVTDPANWRATQPLERGSKRMGLSGFRASTRGG